MTSRKTLTRIAEAFHRSGYPLNERRKSRDDSFTVLCGTASISVCFDGGCWLTMDLSLNGGGNTVHSTQAWNLLCLNAEIHGTARFYSRNNGSFGIRADIAVPKEEAESALISRVQSTVHSISSAHDLSQRSNGNGIPHVTRRPASHERIRRLCKESGWHFVEQSSLCAIGLKVPERMYHAPVYACPEGGVVISVMMTDVTDWGSLQRKGLSHLLLEFSEAIRLVRPSSLVNDEGFQVVMFDLFLGQDFTVRELDLGLSSLSVACQLIGDELAGMKSERIAGEYLAVAGWPLASGNTHHSKGAKHHEHVNT